MFGVGTFGELSFAEPLTASGRRPPVGFGGGIGGSGFPEDWFAKMAAGQDDDRRRRREAEGREITDLIELGLL